MILGVLSCTSGSIRIENARLAQDRVRALMKTNFAAVYAPLPGNLSVVQNLRFFGLLYDVENLKLRIEEMLEAFDLLKLRDTKFGLLSSGEQMRVCLAKALINRPRLLLLDEPTASLDPATALDIRAKILECAALYNMGILWTTHNMYEVTQVCDRVLFLSRGKILLEGAPKSLPGDYGKETLEDLFISVAREPLTLEGAQTV
jgi:ABC-2 type transport system ATP-binding protein